MMITTIWMVMMVMIMMLSICLVRADIHIRSSSSSSVSYTAHISLDVNRHPVSPALYGVNGLPVDMLRDRLVGSTRMGGGDPTTIYNWRIDADNAGYDWYFTQRPRAPLSNNSADFFVKRTIEVGAQPIVDIETSGWVAKGRDACCSFPTSKFAGQDRSLNGCGNGKWINGSSIAAVYGPQRDCYITAKPSDEVDFMAHLRELVGPEVFDREAIVQLGNEWEWEIAQHNDIRGSEFVGYDEAWNRTISYASALKTAFPKLRVMGFVTGAYIGMWCSGKDGQGWHCPTPPGPDYLSHNKTYFWPYLLQQLEKHHSLTGMCALDYVDFYYYPLYNAQQDDSDPNIQKQMLSIPRSFWDPTYYDLSGALNPINGSHSPAILRQIHEWLDLYHPSCKVEIAITEFALGGNRASTTALILVESLSIFARERVAISNLFQTPNERLPNFQAYAFYLNYDNKSSRVTGDNVQADVNASTDDMTLFAQHHTNSSTLFVKVFHKANTTTASVSLLINSVVSSSSQAEASVYQMTALPHQLVHVNYVGNITITFDGAHRTAVAQLSVPVRTAQLIVIKNVQMSDADVFQFVLVQAT